MPPKSGWKSNIHGLYILAKLPADIYPRQATRGQKYASTHAIATNLATLLTTAFPDDFRDEPFKQIVRNITIIWRNRDKILGDSATATGDEETAGNNNTQQQTWIKAHTPTQIFYPRRRLSEWIQWIFSDDWWSLWHKWRWNRHYWNKWNWCLRSKRWKWRWKCI